MDEQGELGKAVIENIERTILEMHAQAFGLPSESLTSGTLAEGSTTEEIPQSVQEAMDALRPKFYYRVDEYIPETNEETGEPFMCAIPLWFFPERMPLAMDVDIPERPKGYVIMVHPNSLPFLREKVEKAGAVLIKYIFEGESKDEE